MSMDNPFDELNAEYARRVALGDAQSIIDLYDEEAIRMPPGRPMLCGRSAILDDFREMFRSTQATVRFPPALTRVMGDSVVGTGVYFLTTTDRDGSVSEEIGKYVGVYRQDRHGVWRILWQISNRDVGA